MIVAHAVLVGTPALLATYGIELPAALTEAVDAARADGLTAVVVAWDGVAQGVLVVGDTVAAGSAAAVAPPARAGPAPDPAHR